MPLTGIVAVTNPSAHTVAYTLKNTSWKCSSLFPTSNATTLASGQLLTSSYSSYHLVRSLATLVKSFPKILSPSNIYNLGMGLPLITFYGSIFLLILGKLNLQCFCITKLPVASLHAPQFFRYDLVPQLFVSHHQHQLHFNFMSQQHVKALF